MSAKPYRIRIRVAFALGISALVAAALVAAGVMRTVAPGESFWLVYPALLAVCALAFAALLPWWRRLDDMQKTGHLVSYYWGGLGGGLAVMLGLVAATGRYSDVSLGALYTILGQAAGFLAFLAVWQLRRTGPTE